MTEHFKNIFGWFEFSNTYDRVLLEHDNAIFVEIGCFLGKSACYLGEQIVKSGKNIKLICVDLWPTKDELAEFSGLGAGQGAETKIITELDKTPMEFFIANMNAANLRDVVFPIRCDSSKAAQLFPDDYFSLIFIDAGHSYEQVTKDLTAWFPKLKIGGTIAGHDFNGEVEAAVFDFFKDKRFVQRVPENTWEVRNEPILHGQNNYGGDV